MGTEGSNSIFPSKIQLHSCPAPDTALPASVSQRVGSGEAAARQGRCREAVPSKAGDSATGEAAIGNTTVFEMRDSIPDKITQ